MLTQAVSGISLAATHGKQTTITVGIPRGWHVTAAQAHALITGASDADLAPYRQGRVKTASTISLSLNKYGMGNTASALIDQQLQKQIASTTTDVMTFQAAPVDGMKAALIVSSETRTGQSAGKSHSVVYVQGKHMYENDGSGWTENKQAESVTNALQSGNAGMTKFDPSTLTDVVATKIKDGYRYTASLTGAGMEQLMQGIIAGAAATDSHLTAAQRNSMKNLMKYTRMKAAFTVQDVLGTWELTGQSWDMTIQLPFSVFFHLFASNQQIPASLSKGLGNITITTTDVESTAFAKKALTPPSSLPGSVTGGTYGNTSGSGSGTISK